MKFSVLLPTRNRLQYLRYAVETVLRQDYDDWELIISDNDSEEDVAGYVRSLGDERVKYYRTESFVPVTDNWNNALEKSRGEYVIMLGDDDCLMPGYFTTLDRLIEEYDSPDVIRTRAYLYAYPGVMQGFPEGFLRPFPECDVFPDPALGPRFLDRKQAVHLAERSLSFEMLLGYNIQFSTIRRTFIESLEHKGKFFQSAFPDFYTTNVLLLKAERLLICPLPLVAIGISPKSYGYFHFNSKESQGIEFLNSFDPEDSARLRRIVLPGTHMNTGWLSAMESLALNYGAERNLRVNYRRYRILQTIYVYDNFYMLGMVPRETLKALEAALRPWERLVFGGGVSFLLKLARLMRPEQHYRLIQNVRQRLVRRFRQYPEWSQKPLEGEHRNILQVFERVRRSGNQNGILSVEIG